MGYSPLFSQKRNNPLGFLSDARPLGPEELLQKVNKLSKYILAVSMFFFSWAVLNTLTMKKGFDLGVISFALSGLSSVYLYFRTRNDISDFIPLRIIHRVGILLSHLIVAANYALGVYFSFYAGKTVYPRFATYCVIFTIIWTGVSIYTWRLIGQTMDINAFVAGDDDIDDMYGFGSNERPYSLYSGNSDRRDMGRPSFR